MVVEGRGSWREVGGGWVDGGVRWGGGAGLMVG